MDNILAKTMSDSGTLIRLLEVRTLHFDLCRRNEKYTQQLESAESFSWALSIIFYTSQMYYYDIFYNTTQFYPFVPVLVNYTLLYDLSYTYTKTNGARINVCH